MYYNVSPHIPHNSALDVTCTRRMSPKLVIHWLYVTISASSSTCLIFALLAHSCK